MTRSNIIIRKVTVLCAVALCSSSLLAAECDINLSTTHIDYGTQQHPAGAVGQQATHNLDRREIRLTATCWDDSTIELHLRGAVLGNQMKFSDQGQVSVKLGQAQLDGRPVGLAKLTDIGAPTTAVGTLAAAPDDTIVPMEGGLPARGKTLVLSLEIIPQLPLSDLRSRDAKVHEGNLRIDASGT